MPNLPSPPSLFLTGKSAGCPQDTEMQKKPHICLIAGGPFQPTMETCGSHMHEAEAITLSLYLSHKAQLHVCSGRINTP